jgi:hemoglobin
VDRSHIATTARCGPPGKLHFWTRPSFRLMNLTTMMTPTATNSSLYQRLGGYDVIAAFVDDTYQMLRNDSRFSRFAARSIDSQQRSRQLLVDQICHLAGGPCYYTGRDMKTSHAGLHITETEWEISLDYTRQALKNHGVEDREANEVIALFNRYRADIVDSSV